MRPPPAIVRVLAALAGLAGVLGVLLALAGPASAHAVLVGSTPTDGAHLSQSPPAITLTFDEPVQLVRESAKVLNARFTLQNSPSAASATGRTVHIPVSRELTTGAYLVTWQVVSADGHTVSGSLRFGVRAAADARLAAPAADEGESGLSRAHDILTGFANGSAVLVIGVPLVALVVTRRRLAPHAIPLVVLGVAIDVVISIALILVDAARASGEPLMSTAALGRAQLGVHGEQMLLLRILAGIALVGVMLAGRSLERAVGLRATAATTGVVLLALVVSHAWIGHASTGSWQWAALIAAAAHITAVTVWIAGLLLLIVGVLPGRMTSGRDALHPWSVVAATCVVVLVLSGVVQALRQVDPVASLWSTAYGVLVLAKVAVLLVVVCVVLAVRWLLHRRGMLIKPFVIVELGLLVVVLVITGVLQSRVPARDDYGPALSASAPLGTDRLRVDLTSTKPGPVRITVARTHGTGVAGLQELDGTLNGEVSGPVTLPVRFQRAAGRTWVAKADLPAAGQWRLQLNARIRSELAYATTVDFRVW